MPKFHDKSSPSLDAAIINNKHFRETSRLAEQCHAGDTFDDIVQQSIQAATHDHTEHPTTCAPAATRYSHLRVEAALCIWEEWLSRHNAHAGERWAAFDDYWHNHGTVEMRH